MKSDTFVEAARFQVPSQKAGFKTWTLNLNSELKKTLNY